MPRHLIFLLTLTLLFTARHASGQCGLELETVHGGDTTAIAYVDTNVTIMARGLSLDLMRSTGVDATPSSIATVHLESPVKKISMSFGSGYAFVLMENGTITVVNVAVIGQVVTFHRGETIGNGIDTFVDIVAAGTRVHAVEYSTFYSGPTLVHESTLKFYEFSGATPALLSTVVPLTASYRFDRAVRVGNRLWSGFRQVDSNIYGVDAIDYSDPAAPVRSGTSLNFINLNNGRTEVTAMAAIGFNVFIAYRDLDETWMRAVDTTNPTSVVWRPPVDLNSIAERIAVVGSQLHVAAGAAGISVWNAANPAALAWLGTTSISGGQVHDVAGVPGTDYVAAGHAGFVTLNSASPGSMTNRSVVASRPPRPIAIRQHGARSIMLDEGGLRLRISDFSLSGAAQSIGTLPISRASFLELSIQPGGQYAVLGGGSSGSNIQVIDIGNPAAPFLMSLSTISTNSIRAMSCSGSRLYLVDSNNVFYIVDVSNPASPVIRRTLPLATTPPIEAIASWPNAAAIAWGTRGATLFDTTSATSPILAATWNPASGYDARSLAKGPNALYVGSRVPGQGFTGTVPRLEAIDVGALSSPTSIWSRVDLDADWLRDIESLTYVVNGSDHLLAASGPYFDGQGTVRVFDVTHPAGAPEVARRDVWNAFSPVAAAFNGSRLLCAADSGGIVELITPTQWEPVLGSHPTGQEACIGGTVSFSLAAPAVSARPVAMLRWQRGGVLLTDGPTASGSIITGSNTSTLIITGARAADIGFYSLRAENTCGIGFSAFAELRFPCIADFNCSGTVTVQDIFDFLAAYFSGNTLADVNAAGGLSVQDIFDFLAGYFSGCP